MENEKVIFNTWIVWNGHEIHTRIVEQDVDDHVVEIDVTEHIGKPDSWECLDDDAPCAETYRQAMVHFRQLAKNQSTES
jgi:hypothetical protein